VSLIADLLCELEFASELLEYCYCSIVLFVESRSSAAAPFASVSELLEIMYVFCLSAGWHGISCQLN